VATVRDGVPEVRIMVLRAVDRHSASLRFHTDARSDKCRQRGPASILAYDADARIQIRVTGTISVQASGAVADAAWAEASQSSRRCYLAEPGPGTAIDGPASGLRPDLETRIPTRAESEAGRANFAVMLFTAKHIDWLHLAATGHRRAAFACLNGEWRGHWVIP